MAAQACRKELNTDLCLMNGASIMGKKVYPVMRYVYVKENVMSHGTHMNESQHTNRRLLIFVFKENVAHTESHCVYVMYSCRDSRWCLIIGASILGEKVCPVIRYLNVMKVLCFACA